MLEVTFAIQRKAPWQASTFKSTAKTRSPRHVPPHRNGPRGHRDADFHAGWNGRYGKGSTGGLSDDIRANHPGQYLPFVLPPRHPRAGDGGRAAQIHGLEATDLTDSGGYQVFSLSDRRKITEEGDVQLRHRWQQAPVRRDFHGHPTGIGRHHQGFDEAPPASSDYGYARESMERTPVVGSLHRAFGRHAGEVRIRPAPLPLCRARRA